MSMLERSSSLETETLEKMSSSEEVVVVPWALTGSALAPGSLLWLVKVLSELESCFHPACTFSCGPEFKYLNIEI